MKQDNNVILLDYSGSDKTHCLAAWQSTGVELGIDLHNISLENRVNTLFDVTVPTKKKSPKELLAMLAESGHTSPFEFSHFLFQVTADIPTHIHLLKHRIAVSINTESARYKELEDKWYIPEEFYKTLVNGDLKEQLKDRNILGENYGDVLDHICKLQHLLYHTACSDLTPKEGRKRSKEISRYFLPYNKQLNFFVAFNFLSFLNMFKKRAALDKNGDFIAQNEVANIATSMLKQIKEIEGNPFKDSIEAWSKSFVVNEN